MLMTRLLLAYGLAFLDPRSTVPAETQAEFALPSGVQVRIVEATFDASRFKIEGCVPGGAVCRINGRVPFGVAVGLPRTYVKHITVTFRGQSYMLDSSDMYDAWGSRPLEHKGVVRYFGGRCEEAGLCHLRGIFSDGVGSFVAEWRVVNGTAIRTVLTDSIDVVHLFTKNIDPLSFE
jgi:hypothetical protein